MVDAVGTNRYTYTAWGALLSEDGPWADDTVTYAYTTNRLRSKLTLAQPNASDWAQTYAYDLARRLGDQAHHGQGAHRLAAPGFPDERDRLALSHVPRHAVDGPHHAGRGPEVRLQIPDLEKRGWRHRGTVVADRKRASGRSVQGLIPAGVYHSVRAPPRGGPTRSRGRQSC